MRFRISTFLCTQGEYDNNIRGNLTIYRKIKWGISTICRRIKQDIQPFVEKLSQVFQQFVENSSGVIIIQP